jgi:hypothetical protein
MPRDPRPIVTLSSTQLLLSNDGRLVVAGSASEAQARTAQRSTSAVRIRTPVSTPVLYGTVFA